MRPKLPWLLATALLLPTSAARSDDAPLAEPPRITATWQDADVHEVLGTLQRTAGRHVIVAKDVVGKVTLTLEQVPWREAVDRVAAAVGASVTEEANGRLVLFQPGSRPTVYYDVRRLLPGTADLVERVRKAAPTAEAVEERNGVVIVRTTRAEHESVRALLEELRGAAGQDEPPPPPPDPPPPPPTVRAAVVQIHDIADLIAGGRDDVQGVVARRWPSAAVGIQGTALVVRAAPHVQDEIGHYLAGLRAAGAEEAPAARRAPEPLLVTATWRDADVREVLATLAQVSGRNLIVAEDVQGKVTVTVKDTPWRSVLDSVAGVVGAQVVEEPYGLLRLSRTPGPGPSPSDASGRAPEPPAPPDSPAGLRAAVESLRAEIRALREEMRGIRRLLESR